MSTPESDPRDPVTLAGSLLALSEPELRARIQKLMAQVPALSTNGLGQSHNHAPEAHARARSVLASSAGEEQVRHALLWLAHSGVKPAPVARARIGSYDAKHRAERWSREHGSRTAYVSNGAMIVACLLTGVDVLGIENSVNAWLGLTVKSQVNVCPWAA